MSRWSIFLYDFFGYKTKEYYVRLCEIQSCDIQNLNKYWSVSLEENLKLKNQIDKQQSTFQIKFNKMKNRCKV